VNDKDASHAATGCKRVPRRDPRSYAAKLVKVRRQPVMVQPVPDRAAWISLKSLARVSGISVATRGAMIRAILLYTPAGGGHRAAAGAVAAELRTLPGARVQVHDVLAFAPRWFAYDRAWSAIQRHGVHAWDWLFDASDRGAIDLDPIRLPLHRALFAELDRFLLEQRPTHIVCTHYLPAVAAARVAKQIGARTVITITDHLAHRAWLVPGIDAYCVADAAVARALRRRTSADVVTTGIPIARAVGAPVRAVAPQLARARVLALLGGVRRSDAFDVIGALAPLAHRGHALHVLTGDDPEVLAYARRRMPVAEIAPRADGLLPAMDAADVVVTKAGGLTVSECLARGRAMVLPFAAPGQERGNLFYALDAGAAIRPSEILDTGHAVEALIGEPSRLRKMSARARLASQPDAAAAVARCVLGAASHEVNHAA
jgi:processive 1,2-diacylglycerol beta-glucosyltransferase